MRRHLSLTLDLRRNTPLTLIVLGLLAAVLALLPTTARSTVTWRGDYETGTLSQWNLGVQQKADGRVAVGTSIIHQGRYAARFEVRSGDNNVAGSGTGERAEVLLSSSTTEGSEGREAYWAWSTFFPSDFTAPGGAWNVFTQFHHTGSSGQSNIHFDVRDMSTIGLRVLGGDEAAAVRKDFTLAPLQRGRWYDFVFHVKWSTSASTGFVEVWVNGSRVVPKTFTPTLYNGQGTYLKQGYYRAAYSGTTVVYHDGMRKGSSYDEVAAEFPSGGSTTPFTVSQNLADGSTLAGTPTWSASPAGKTVAKVDFAVDGQVVATDTTSPYETSLNTSTLANGSHAFKVTATATDGATTFASATATVSNQTTALGVSQNVTSGQTVSGALYWSATPSGKTVSRVEFMVNGALVKTENYAPYEFTFDTKSVTNGTYPFAVKAVATDGSTATATALVTVQNANPTTFAVTQNVWDGIVLRGTYLWEAKAAGKAISRVRFYVDGRQVALENHSPYTASMDTRALSDGSHAFEALAFAADGTRASAKANVVVANTSAPPPPPPSTTLGVTQSLSSGQTISGLVAWTANWSGTQPERIEFWIDGSYSWTERYSPYVYGGDGQVLDTRKLSNGAHTLMVKAYAAGGATASSSATVTVSNGTSSTATTATTTSSGTSSGGTSSGGTTSGGGSSGGTSSGGTSSGGASSDPAPTLALTSSIKDGETITGSLLWEITPTGKSVSRVEFFIEDKLMWTENIAPYRFGGDQGRLDTGTLHRGWRTLVVKAYATDGSMVQLTLRVKIA